MAGLAGMKLGGCELLAERQDEHVEESLKERQLDVGAVGPAVGKAHEVAVRVSELRGDGARENRREPAPSTRDQNQGSSAVGP